MATFDELQSGGIRSLVPPDDPNADKANRILAVACAPAQIALDVHLTTPHDIHAETLTTLGEWQAALALAEVAMSEAHDLVQANQGVITSTTDGLGHTTYHKTFPPTQEKAHARTRR